jgi:hypothetical protein
VDTFMDTPRRAGNCLSGFLTDQRLSGHRSTLAE